MHMCIVILISQQTQHSDIIWIIITLRKMHVYAVLHIYICRRRALTRGTCIIGHMEHDRDVRLSYFFFQTVARISLKEVLEYKH